jgi:hypothetical protein
MPISFGAPPPEAEESTLRAALDWLGRPGAATAGAVRAYQRGDDPVARALRNLRGETRDDFDDVLADAGYEDTWGRRAAGFAGDVALDPLNLVPVGGATRLGGKVLGQVGEVAARGLRSVGLDSVVEGAKAARNAIGEAFIPYDHLRELPEYAKSRRLFDSERRTLPNRVFEDVATRYQGLTPEQRKMVGLALDAGDDAALDPALRAVLGQQRKVYDDIGTTGVNLGILDEDAVASKAGHYAPYVFRNEDGFFREGVGRGRRVNPTSPFAKERETASLAEAIANGAEPDAAVAALVRELDGERSRQSAQFLRDTVLGQYGSVLERPGYVRVDSVLPLSARQSESLGRRYIPEAIAKDLAKISQGGGERAALLKGLDAVMQQWRTGATVLRPGFHATNLIGNLYNGALGGLTNPLDIATRYAQGMGAKSASPELVASLGRNLDPAQINDLMRKHGLTPVGGADAFGAGELSSVGSTNGLAGKLTATLDGTDTATRNPIKAAWRAYSGAMHGLGNTIEGGSKRALFYDELAKGMSPEDAVLAVKDKLFDYAELTDLEKNVGRNILPFYTWTRKNVPLQLRSLVDRPAVPAFVAKGTDALEDLGEDRGTATPEALRPEWYQKQGFLPLPFGFREGGRAYVNPYLPIADLNKIAGLGEMSSLEDALGDVVSGLSPLIKAPIELGTNRNFFQQKEVYDSALGFLGDKQRAPGLLQIPGIRDVAQVLPGISRDPQTGETVLPVATNYTFEQALPFLSSVGRAGQSFMSPEESGNAAGWMKFLGLPVAERSAAQQARDATAASTRRKRLATAEAGQAALDTATLDDTDDRAARLYARFLAGQ